MTFKVSVSKPGHQFTIPDICCRQAAEIMCETWQKLGYRAQIVEEES